MTNFDFLKAEKRFDSFADVAITAEKLLHISVDDCVICCRRAMEFAIKWMYSVDRDLEMPYQDTLVALMNDEKFRDIVGDDIWRRMDFIRKVGNNAAHSGKKVNEEQAKLCIENLFYILDQVAYFYADTYEPQTFDPELLKLTVSGMRLSSLAFVIVGSQIVISSFFQSIGQARMAVFLTTTRQLLFLIPALIVLPLFFGLDGVWLSLPLSDILSEFVTVIMLVYYMKKTPYTHSSDVV